MYKKKLILTSLVFIILSIVLGIALYKILAPQIAKITNKGKETAVVLPSPGPSATPGVLAAATESAQIGFGPTPQSAPQTVLKQQASTILQPSPESQTLQQINLQQKPTEANCEITADSLTVNVDLNPLTSQFIFTFIQPSGMVTSGGEIQVPAGWTIPASSSILQGAQIATGCFKHVFNGNTNTSQVTIINDQNTQGHLARWNIVFGNLLNPDVTLDSVIDGSSKDGYVWKIDRKFLFDVQPPMTFNLVLSTSHFSKTAKKGNFLFKTLVKFKDNTSTTINKLLSSF